MKKIKGTSGDDRLVGTDADDKILGFGGDDVIVAKGGNDIVDAGNGNDTIKIAGNTSAKVDAGSGSDTVEISAGALGSTIRLGGGNDSVDIADSNKTGQNFSVAGNGGDDAVNFALDQQEYTITDSGNGSYTVVDAHGNSYGLSSISELRFNGALYQPGNPINQAPELATAIADQQTSQNTAFSFQFSATAFTDPDNDALTYSATLADGSALPSWLTFDATTRTFSGTPTAANVGAISVRVTASDGSLSAFDDFVLNVSGTSGGGGGGSPFVNSYGDLEKQHLDNGVPDGQLYAGKGNPATGFALSVNDLAGIELGLDVRYKFNPNEIAPNTVTNVWQVDAEDLKDLRFAYSAGAEKGLGNYDVRLSIDTDGSAIDKFLVLNLGPDQGSNTYNNLENSKFDWFSNSQAVITDDGGDALGTVTQNIQALQWYQQEGLEAGDEFKIKLEAFEQGTGTKLAGTEITILINGHTERVLEDFEGNSDLVVTAGGYGNIALTGQGTATITQTTDPSDPIDGAGPFTRFDHYRSDQPDVVTTSVDIRISAADISSGEGFEYSVAANNAAGTHLRDFVFHIANNGAGVGVAASNNAGDSPANLSGYANTKPLSDGWYTFQHTMYENASHDLEVKLEVIDSSGHSIFTQILTDGSDDFSNFGGNRYGWFAEIDVHEGLEIDNWAIAAQYF
jgi:hypothetical protein